MRLWRKGLVLPVLLLAQGLTVHYAGSFERPPAAPRLSSFANEFTGWKLSWEDPVASDVRNELRADKIISRTYSEPRTGAAAGLFVAWFLSQRAGNSQPHSPKVCLPGAGWTPEQTGEITLRTTAGPITINRYLVSKGTERAVALYWYQTPRRVIAGEWAAKLWLIADGLRYQRTDTALVRVVVWAGDKGDDRATATAARFAGTVYPVLHQYLPH